MRRGDEPGEVGDRAPLGGWSAVVSLQRNDPHAAAAAYRAGLLAGTWTRDKSRLILAMQDDPAELLGLMQAANADPAVGAALRKMMGTGS